MSQQLYTTTELAGMTTEELRAAQANGFVRPDRATVVDVPLPPSPAQDANPYAVTSWGSSLYDFTVPSGQMCQMRKIRPEEMIGTGLLDKISRLPGFAQELITKAEGQPPAKPLSQEEQMALVIEVVDELVPQVVVQPRVYPDDTEDAPEGAVFVRDIELADRIAIMERALGGVRKMDNFRQES